MSEVLAENWTLFRSRLNGIKETANGIEASGGALDGASPVVAKGHLIVNSGYAFFNQMPGNVLLVFQVPQGR